VQDIEGLLRQNARSNWLSFAVSPLIAHCFTALAWKQAQRVPTACRLQESFYDTHLHVFKHRRRANVTAHYHESDDRHTGGISSLAKSRQLPSVIGESSIAAIESSMQLPENERDYRFDRLRSE